MEQQNVSLRFAFNNSVPEMTAPLDVNITDQLTPRGQQLASLVLGSEILPAVETVESSALV